MSQYFRLTVKYRDAEGNVKTRDDMADTNEKGLAQYGLAVFVNGLAFKEGDTVRIIPGRDIISAEVKSTILRPDEAKLMNVQSLDNEIGKKK